MSYQFRFRHFAECLYEALKEDAFYQTMEQSVEDQQNAREAMLKYLDYSISESERYGELFVPDKHQFGVSVWSKPISEELGVNKSQEKKAFLRNEMGENALLTYERIVEFMSEKADVLIQPGTWYLSIIGILPAFQGQGLGPDLVKPVLAKTDQLKVPSYLETFTPRNMSFYERLGYHEIATINEPTTGKDYAIMKREPHI